MGELINTEVKQPGIHIDTEGVLYLNANEDYKLTVKSNSSNSTWGYHHNLSLGDTLSAYVGGRETLVGGADATVKGGVDITIKAAADISLFLGPKVEAAATVGKFAAAKSILSAAHNHTFGEAAKLGAVSNAVEALEQRCTVERMRNIASAISAVGETVSAIGAATETIATRTELAAEATELANMRNSIGEMNNQVHALTTMV